MSFGVRRKFGRQYFHQLGLVGRIRKDPKKYCQALFVVIFFQDIFYPFWTAVGKVFCFKRSEIINTYCINVYVVCITYNAKRRDVKPDSRQCTVITNPSQGM